MTAISRALLRPDPTSAPELRFCDECGKPFYVTAHGKAVNQRLHSAACNTVRRKRRMHDAYRIIDAVIEWRLDGSDGSLHKLCHILDNGLIDEERRVRARRNEVVSAAKKAMGGKAR